MNILNKIQHFFSLDSELKNFIINESIKSPLFPGSAEYSSEITKIAADLSLGKIVILVIDGELVSLKIQNNKIIKVI